MVRVISGCFKGSIGEIVGMYLSCGVAQVRLDNDNVIVPIPIKCLANINEAEEC